MADETPVLDTIAAMTLVSVERCDLDLDALLLVRIAALAAVDAKPASYLLHVGPAVEAGVTIDQVQDVLVAVAPIIGTARVMSASMAITEALGIAIEIMEAEMDAELES
jgi:alkylhydroperoxidase/carboxymuconolactone decarboxylase family protein YurZ